MRRIQRDDLVEVIAGKDQTAHVAAAKPGR